MKKIIFVLLAFNISPVLLRAQTTDNSANEAYVLTRMVNKFHVDPRAVNSAFSADVFEAMLKRTDADKIFFNKSDIAQLGVYSKSLDAEIKQRKTAYLKLFTNIYRLRLKQADSLVTEISKKPFDIYAAENFTVSESTSYPTALADMKLKLYKKLKAAVIDGLIDDLPANFKSFTPLKQKKYVDSAMLSLQKKVEASLKRKINNVLQNPYGINQYVGNIYCETIASCFDPHTEFFPPEEKENFESEMGKQPFLFGFNIKEDKNGGVIIEGLEPGSPAFKGGKLNKGDKFVSVQWEGSQPVDVSDITSAEFGSILDESNHKRILFTVKKTDGSVVQVSLQKEQMANDQDSKVSSLILKGDNTVGYIYLPDFYEDWEVGNHGLNGCANDVGREILKLKKENIKGLILDLRYNGGGSLEEATELAGIFIDAGPVEQEKGKDAKIYTLKDFDRGTIYDGPLVILVNGYSASASELVAGTLQDYNRAVIIGSPTYGKATAQAIFPMDTTATYETAAQKQTKNYIKITISKLYRVNGTTAQFSGVQPDILLPDMLDAYIAKEKDEQFALRPAVINANKYYTPYAPLPVKSLAADVQTEIDTSTYFKAVKGLIGQAKKDKAPKDISLNIKDALANIDPAARDNYNVVTADKPSKNFTVQNNQYEMARLQADASLKILNAEFSKQVAADADINIAYDVLAKLKP